MVTAQERESLLEEKANLIEIERQIDKRAYELKEQTTKYNFKLKELGKKKLEFK